ncbi:MAG: hypothetical protein ACFWT6_10790 [Virgibacillus proomii]
MAVNLRKYTAMTANARTDHKNNPTKKVHKIFIAIYFNNR